VAHPKKRVNHPYKGWITLPKGGWVRRMDRNRVDDG